MGDNGMKSVILIGTYYGKFTDFISLFWKTVALNPTIDFLLITDIDCENSVPSNVKILKYTFEQLKDCIQKKYRFKIGKVDNYTICKFRPAFGDIFEDYLGDYDYWGYNDYDILLGDIRHFFTDVLLEKYDKFLSHGHFTLFRNNKEMRTLYKQKGRGTIDYKQVFQSDFLIGHFEEYPYGISRLAKEKNVLVYEAPIFADLDPFFYSFRKIYSYYDMCEDDSEHIKQYFEWSDGRLFDCVVEGDTVKKEECLYVHFHKRKMNIELSDLNETWYIVPNTITNVAPNLQLIFKDNKEELEYCHNKMKEVRIKQTDKVSKIKKAVQLKYWKRKWYLFKAKKIYKIAEYQFLRGGF